MRIGSRILRPQVPTENSPLDLVHIYRLGLMVSALTQTLSRETTSLPILLRQKLSHEGDKKP